MKKYLPLWILLLTAAMPHAAAAQTGRELRFVLQGKPKTSNPLLVEDDAAESVRYLTRAVLIRVNRLTQDATPELATCWKISNGGRSIAFELRPSVHFSDGTPFSAEDVAYTMTQLMDPPLHSPTRDAFRSSEGQIRVKISASDSVEVIFPAPIAGLERLFDQVEIMSAKSSHKEMAVLGP